MDTKQVLELLIIELTQGYNVQPKNKHVAELVENGIAAMKNERKQARAALSKDKP